MLRGLSLLLMVVLVILLAWGMHVLYTTAHPFVVPPEPERSCAVADPDHYLSESQRTELCALLANSPADPDTVFVELVVMNSKELLGNEAVRKITKAWHVDVDSRPRLLLLWDPWRDSLDGYANLSASVDWKEISHNVGWRTSLYYGTDDVPADVGARLVVEETRSLLGRG